VDILDQHKVCELEKMLGKIEQETGKTKRNRPKKWTDTRLKEKAAYLRRILQISSIFPMNIEDFFFTK